MIFWNINYFAGMANDPEVSQQPRVWMNLRAFANKGSWTYPYAGRVLAHEIGHVFGIKHTHNIDSGIENCECTSFDEKFSSFDGMLGDYCTDTPPEPNMIGFRSVGLKFMDTQVEYVMDEEVRLGIGDAGDTDGSRDGDKDDEDESRTGGKDKKGKDKKGKKEKGKKKKGKKKKGKKKKKRRRLLSQTLNEDNWNKPIDMKITHFI